MYICDFSRSVGAGRAITRKTRGLTRSVIALIVPPFPAGSRPSNTMMARSPLAFTYSWRMQSPSWRRSSSFSNFLRFSFSMSGLLPSSTEGSIQFGAGTQLGAARLRQPQLLREPVLIGRQNLDIAGEPGIIAGARQVRGVDQRGDADFALDADFSE